MRENFLHYVWGFKKFELLHLQTAQFQSLRVVSVGTYNENSGPDFFNAKLRIDNQLWAGNVEIHIKSSDWYAHRHDHDDTYDNVILHVVYEHDADVFRKDGSIIPTLVLKPYIHKNVYLNYQRLFARTKSWILCETDFASVDDFVLKHWLERLYFERLEQKAKHIKTSLKATNKNWEAVLFMMLAKNFGLKVNGDAFFSMAKSFDFKIVQKLHNQKDIEALFFGQAGLLETENQNVYYKELQETYKFLKQKFQLNNSNIIPLQFFRLRPLNFPTIRLSQLAALYIKEFNLFSKIIEINTLEGFYDIFQVEVSEFWKSHYTFAKLSPPRTKVLTKSFIDLLLINTILPIQFCYKKEHGKLIEDDLMVIISKINSEENTIIKKYNAIKKISTSAMHSQALIQLKTKYCDKHQCLKCAIGNTLLNR
ncbi:DUF2851 family protein [Psychroserpens sp. XS_ASV72]|uniref:DUF2851 family protein n=1 Tax=Psychroserpens sp. XS_ASV72 TaxID=3241293 RepID=UPI00351396B4